ncbi:MAG: alpha/beta hydrolase [Calditrichota bacterium]
MKDTHALKLLDGRQLGYRILGNREGLPFFFFHGTPGSRFVISENDLLAQIDGLRLIIPERPGYGRSSTLPKRTLLDWAEDVQQLADSLGIDKFSVAGVSGGGPHALACAHELPNRINTLFLLSSNAPVQIKGATNGMALGNKLGFFLNRYAPGLASWLLNSQAKTAINDLDVFIDALIPQLAEPDRKQLAKDFVRDAIRKDIEEAFSQGADGIIADNRAFSADWGFRVEDVRTPTYLWYGMKDTLVTETMARYLAEHIPQCKATFVTNAAHLLTEEPSVVDEIKEILFTKTPIKHTSTE